MEPVNISFFGGMGAGKSTCAKYLAEKKTNYEHVPMANALKDAAEILWGPEARTSREKLQALGKYVREIDPDTLLNSFLREATPIWDAGGVVITDDMRYANEYWGLKERGFVFVRVLANEAVRVDRLLKNGKLDDVSQLEDETEKQLVGLAATKKGIVDDYTIFNNGSDEELFASIEDVLMDIEEKS